MRREGRKQTDSIDHGRGIQSRSRFFLDSGWLGNALFIRFNNPPGGSHLPVGRSVRPKSTAEPARLPSVRVSSVAR
jgi:hypothetical protein